MNLHTLYTYTLLCALGGLLFAANELSPEETRQIEEAKAAWRRTPEGSAATRKFNKVRSEYRHERAKFPADRNGKVALSYRKALKEYDNLQRKAILARNPALAPLLTKADSATRAPNPALLAIKDQPGLPRVLLIGDSISIGYTLDVRKILKDKANVHRIPQNGGAIDIGLTKMKSWLGDAKWDVIHFNFGLHDAKFMSQTTLRSTREQYATNLCTLVAQMKATGAKLIFATTTPVPNGGKLSPTRKFDSIPERNKVAFG
jgi:hypothetical protein